MVRGRIVHGERPAEIAVVFNQERIKAIFESDVTKQRFMLWLQRMVYHALKVKEENNEASTNESDVSAG